MPINSHVTSEEEKYLFHYLQFHFSRQKKKFGKKNLKELVRSESLK